MKLPPFALSLALSVTLLVGCASAPQRPTNLSRGDYAATHAYVSRLIEHGMAQNTVTGLSIALVDDQRVVWSQGFGYADLARKVPATPGTLYRVGSISKLFTDTAAMQLAERGLLNIDQPLQKILPDFAPLSSQAPAAITARQLMTHHSGLPRDKMQGFHTATPEPISELTTYVRQTPVAYPPGHTFHYSNLGISVLGDVVQRVSGTPFAQQLQQSVLAPLGMNDSSFSTAPALSERMSLGYAQGVAQKEWPQRDVPAGGLNSSANDLARFMSMVFAQGKSSDHQVLKPETVAEMLRPQNSAVPLDLNFSVGLGWMLSTLGKSTLQNAGPVAHHAGSIGRFRSQMMLLPTHKLGVVILANSESAIGLVDYAASEALSLALEVKTGIQPVTQPKIEWADTPISADTLQAAVGDYASAIGPITVNRDGSHLRAHAHIPDRSFKLRLRKDCLLGLEYVALGLFAINMGPLSDVGISLRKVADHDLLIARIGAQEMRVGQRIQAPANLGIWRKRLGEYEITNLDEPELADHGAKQPRIRFVEERGYLVAHVNSAEAPGQTMRLVLMPTSDTEARVLDTLAEGGDTVRVVIDKGVEKFVYSGYIGRKK